MHSELVAGKMKAGQWCPFGNIREVDLVPQTDWLFTWRVPLYDEDLIFTSFTGRALGHCVGVVVG